MDDNIKYIEKQIEKNRIEAEAMRRQAEVERNKASQYSEPDQDGDRIYHTQQAEQLDSKADQYEAEANTLEPKKAQIEARINELKTQRETINREALDKTLAIDKELAQIQGSMTI